MKVTPKDVVRQLGGARAVLLYGPDEGLLKQTIEKIMKAKGILGKQDLGYRELTAKALKDDPALLGDEAMAFTLLVSQQVIVVPDASDSLSALIKQYFETPRPDHVCLVLQGGELGPASSLRKFFESSPQALSVACYALSGGDLAASVRRHAQASGKVLNDEALHLCCQSLGNDAAITSSELEKLFLYVGDRSNVTAEDVRAVLSLNAETGSDDFIYALFEKNKKGALDALSALEADGVEPIVLIRSLLRHVRRLREVHLYRTAEGLTFQQAAQKLSPPLFWKTKDRFLKSAQQISLTTLDQMEDQLNALELASKQSGSLPSLLVQQYIHTRLAA